MTKTIWRHDAWKSYKFNGNYKLTVLQVLPKLKHKKYENQGIIKIKLVKIIGKKESTTRENKWTITYRGAKIGMTHIRFLRGNNASEMTKEQNLLISEKQKLAT